MTMTATATATAAMSKQQEEANPSDRRRRRRRRIVNNNRQKMTTTTTTTAAMLILFMVAVLTAQVVTATPLLNGRYETVTDVTSYLNLALDAADMRETNDITTKQNIYRNVSLQAEWKQKKEGQWTITTVVFQGRDPIVCFCVFLFLFQ
jgi:hypothetical protein